MFKVRETKREFQRFLKDRIKNVPLSDAFSSLLDFYADARAQDALPVEESGDMLLFQWGAYDWGSGNNFEINLTRQLIVPDKDQDDDIWQLMLTYYFSLSEEFVALGSGQGWCEQPDHLPAFRDFVDGSKSFRLCAQRTQTHVELHWEHV